MRSTSSEWPAWVCDNSPIPDPTGAAARNIAFLELLTHPKTGRRIQLDPWQRRILQRIYGPRHPDGTRVVKTVFLLVGRGARKTSLAALIAILHTIGPEHTPGGSAAVAASDRKQAAILFEEAAGILRADRRTDAAVKILTSSKRIAAKRHGARLDVVSSDGARAHGRTDDLVVADEIHAWASGGEELFGALRSGLVKVRGSLLVITTTSGAGTDTLAHEIYEDARKVARGDVSDPSFLPILFACPPDVGLDDEGRWALANPGLAHGYPDIEGLRQMAREAKRRPRAELAFRQLILNQWQASALAAFVAPDVWDELAGPMDLNDLAARRVPAWLGVDMSATSDLSAVAIAWRDGSSLPVLAHAFTPEARLAEHAADWQVPLTAWRRLGHITATPGRVVDHDAVVAWIAAACARFNVREILIDPALGGNVTRALLGKGLPAIEHRQGWRSMAPAVAALDRAIVGGTLRHSGDPAFRWQMTNAVVHEDSAGNRVLHKGKSKRKIDAAVATAMAIGRAASNERKSVSESEWFSDEMLKPI